MSSIDTGLAARILFEDNHILALNKLPSELVQGDETGDITLADAAKEFIRVRDQKPGNVFMGIPHRIDRPVSGVVLYAKTSKALSRLTEMFRLKEIQKTYWAITEKLPNPPTGTLEHYLIKNEKQNKSYPVPATRDGAKKAVLHYSHLCSSDRYHLLEVKLETGRHHQIRVQLAAAGAIIKGDLKYGAHRSNPDGSICLHSRKAEFMHPTRNESVRIIAPCPADALWQWFEKQMGEH